MEAPAPRDEPRDPGLGGGPDRPPDRQLSDRLAPLGLLQAAVCASLAVLAVRWGGLAAAGAVAGLAVLLALRAGRALPCLFAVPAALGAIEWSTPEALWPGPGPIRLEGTVLPGVRRDVVAGRTSFLVRQGPHTLLCVVSGPGTGRDFPHGPVGAERILPGDRVAGLAYLPEQERRRRQGLRPVCEARASGLRITAGPPAPSRVAAELRFALERSLLRLVPGESGAVLCQLVLGAGPAIADDLVDAHRSTGLAHLLAVSGAHASMLAWMLGVLYHLLCRRSPWSSRRYRLVCAVLLLGYGAVTGWEPPVFRALAAYFLMLLAAARGRRVTVSAALALPALLTALCTPGELFGASFCLSYAAVIGPGLAGAFDAHNAFARWVRMPLQASAWAVVTTAPFTLHYFGQLAPWTVLATPLLSPLVALMLGLGVTAAALGLWLPGAAALLAAPLGGMTALYTGCVRFCAELPAAPVFATCRPEPALLAACGLVGALWLWHRPDRRGVIGLCLALCLPYFVPFGAGRAPHLELLAVGHGQALLAELDDGSIALIDCGSQQGEERAARAVDKALRRRRRIDVLVLSHGDRDHSGGVERLLPRVPVVRAVLPRHMAGDRVVALLQRRGASIEWIEPGEARGVAPGLSVFAPAVGDAPRNEQSLWVRLELGGVLSCVLPGDAGPAGIRAWLLRPGAHERARADVLVLPHHGRGSVTACRALLERTRPALALVSGQDGEPETELGAVARGLGVPVLHTGRRGDIRIEARDKVEVHCQWPREVHGR